MIDTFRPADERLTIDTIVSIDTIDTIDSKSLGVAAHDNTTHFAQTTKTPAVDDDELHRSAILGSLAN